MHAKLESCLVTRLAFILFNSCSKGCFVGIPYRLRAQNVESARWDEKALQALLIVEGAL